MGSLAKVEGVLTALQRSLPPLFPELNLRKMTVWGPGLVDASSPLAAATRLHLEGERSCLESQSDPPSTPRQWEPT